MEDQIVVPELPVGESYLLRPWRLDDVVVVEEASTDAYIPLITTVPSRYSEEEGKAFVRRQWSRTTDGVGYSFAIAEAGGRAVGQIGL
ncbi:GNAT family N-acetyltransferase [Nonomuraea sp. NPDC046802]|uniref:GNAT family N-acetyltransferase n=1 Tax=Nonomuraea sp. NPDC046802 TaxID=3154919 RepID=UPI0033D4D4DD